MIGLGLAGAALLFAQFQWWRSGRRARVATLGFGVLWTGWWAEALVRGVDLVVGPPPLSRTVPPPWTEKVQGASVPRALLDLPHEGVTRVLFVGDSFTYGVMVSEGGAIAPQTAARLAAAGRSAQVLNHGMPGLEFSEEVVLYGAYGRTLEPDVVVWNFVLNDIGMPGAETRTNLVSVWEAPAPTGVRVIDRLRTARHLRTSSERVERAYRAAFAVDRPEFRAFEQMLSGLVAETEARGARFVFVIWPLLHELRDYPFREAHGALAGAAQAAGAEVVDLLDVFEGRDETQLWAHLDNHHPNAEGHALAADALAGRLLAQPIRSSGTVDCGAELFLDRYASLVRAACASGAAAPRLLAAAEQIGRSEEPITLPQFAPLRVARALGTLAYWRAKDEDVREGAETFLAELSARLPGRRHGALPTPPAEGEDR